MAVKDFVQARLHFQEWIYKFLILAKIEKKDKWEHQDVLDLML